MTCAELPRIAVLMAAHNRRDLTVRALQSLEVARDVFNLTVILLDDASTDGTANAVQAAWPDAMVLTGDGNAFWNGGMHQAWLRALTLGVDGYLWLNDDVDLDDDALPALAREWHSLGGGTVPFILVGPTRDDGGRLSYGGQKLIRDPFALRFERLPMADIIQRAETFNGNIVLISKATVARIGINDSRFLHTLGDIDYGMRASRAGIPVLVMPGTMGVCNNNPPTSFHIGSLRTRWRRINSHHGIPMRNWWRITCRYSGIWMPLHFILPYRKMFTTGQSERPHSG
jgi:GT2 family glycosyltransferase